MQQQKHNVLVPAKRKHMRPQRHLARKIKTSLQRCRQRTTKLPFAHRTNQNPNPRRFPRHNLLPRHPKPLREDRAQALVALNNIPKRSFQRSHIQRATKPNRQRDHVAPARPLQPLQKPQPALPIRQRHLARTLNRSQRRSRRSRIPQPINQPSYRRRLEQAADRNLNIKARTDAADQTRRQQRMAPKRKNVILNPNTPANSAHSNSSRGLRAKRTAEARTCGAGSAARSSFPFAVSGRRSNTTIADGTM